MLPVETGSSHLVRCVRFDEIDWSVAAAKAEQHDPVATGEIVLNVVGYVEALHDRERRRRPARRQEDRQGQREYHLPRARGRDHRHRRRIGLRQIHLRQGAHGARGRDDRQGSARRSRSRQSAGAKAQREGDLPPADDLPEPVRHAQSEPFDRRADLARDPEVRRRARPRQGRGARQSAPRYRQAAARFRQAPPAPAFGWAEAARRHRARLCRRSRRSSSPTSPYRRSTCRCRRRSRAC